MYSIIAKWVLRIQLACLLIDQNSSRSRLTLQPGDVVECEIDEIGSIKNEVLASSKF